VDFGERGDYSGVGREGEGVEVVADGAGEVQRVLRDYG
jgi:hypothetical protein